MKRLSALRITVSSVLTAALFLSLPVSSAWAQSSVDPGSSQDEPTSELVFDRYDLQSWTTLDGLPQNSVTDIVQTQDGYLWLATFGGLARFDGVRFENFDLSNTEALTTNRILSLFEDRRGDLWIGTQNGGVVRYRDGVFTSYDGQKNAPRGEVWSIVEDSEGVVWFGARKLVRYADGKFELGGPEEWMSRVAQVWSLHVDREGSMWVATNTGLGRFRDGQWREFHVADGLPGGDIRFVHEDSQGLIWVNSQGNNLHYFDDDEFFEVPVQGEPIGWVFAAIVDSDGQYWIGSRDGLFLPQMVRGTGDVPTTLFKRASGFSEVGRVRSLLEDREGNIWVGSDDHGLLRVRAAPFKPVALPSDATYRSPIELAGDGAGGFWVLTNGRIFHRTDDNWSELPQDDEVRAISSVRSSDNGTLWISHDQPRRLSSFREGQFTHIEQDTSTIGQFLVDRQGKVWSSSSNALSTVHDGRIEAVTITDSLPSIGHVDTMGESRDGTVWIGAGDTLYGYRNGAFVKYTSADGLPRGAIRSIYEGSDGNLWISTYGGGLARLTDGEFTLFTTSDGFPENSLGKILEDDDGNLWINGNQGVIRVSLDELNAYADGRRATINSRTFRTGEASGQDGMRSTDGKLWFPTLDGLITIDPSYVKSNDAPPPVVIESVSNADRTFEFSDSVKLPLDVRDFVIEYTGLSFAAPDLVTFRHRLVGYDDDWVDAGTLRFVEYKRLPHGEFQFQVQARNNDRVWSDQTATLTITVPPFWWQTNWAKSLFAVCVVLVLLLALQWRTHALRARGIELESQVRSKTREVRESLSKAQSASESKGRFLANLSHELRTPLNSILGFSEILKMKEADREEQVQYGKIINSAGTHLLDLINEVLDLSRIEAGQTKLNLYPTDVRAVVQEVVQLFALAASQAGLKLTSQVSEDVPERVLCDGNKFKQILINLVGNAVKFTKKGSVELLVEMIQELDEVRMISVIVKDTGVGIPKEDIATIFAEFQQVRGTHEEQKGTGLGLAISHGFARIMGGNLGVKSELGMGSTFELTVPVQTVAAEGAFDESLLHTSPPLNVLIVDDMEANRALLDALIVRLGHRVITARDGFEALHEFSECLPDLVLLDLEMPNLDGYSVIPELRRMEGGIETKIVVISASSSVNNQKRMLALGADAFLAKPFDKDHLYRTLLTLLVSDDSDSIDQSASPSD